MMLAPKLAVLATLIVPMPGCTRPGTVQQPTAQLPKPASNPELDALCPPGWTFLYVDHQDNGRVVCKRPDQGDK